MMLRRKADPNWRRLLVKKAHSENAGVAYPATFPNLVAMARDSQTSASDIIQLLEGLEFADLDMVIAAAERQRKAKRESGKK